MNSRMPGSVGRPLGGDPALAFNTGHSTSIEALEELSVHDVSEKRTTVVDNEKVDEKGATDDIQYVPMDEESFGVGKGLTASEKVDNMEEIALYVLHVDDDPSLNPWTLRTWFPRCTFVMQMVGTLVGSILNYAITLSITTNQREILLSIEGTHIWSGAGLQSFNTQAITWGGLAKQMYSWGSTYQWVPLGLVLGFAAPLPGYFLHRLFSKVGFSYLNMSIICWHIDSW